MSSSSGTDPRDRNFLKNVITGDETWIFEYDPETKRQSKEWHTSASPRPKKARKSKSKIKSMLICFFDSEEIVHTEFVPQGHTVNQFYYCEILERHVNLTPRGVYFNIMCNAVDHAMAHVVCRGLLSMKYLILSRTTLRGIRGAKLGSKTCSL